MFRRLVTIVRVPVSAVSLPFLVSTPFSPSLDWKTTIYQSQIENETKTLDTFTAYQRRKVNFQNQSHIVLPILIFSLSLSLSFFLVSSLLISGNNLFLCSYLWQFSAIFYLLTLMKFPCHCVMKQDEKKKGRKSFCLKNYNWPPHNEIQVLHERINKNNAPGTK